MPWIIAQLWIDNAFGTITSLTLLVILWHEIKCYYYYRHHP